MKRRFREPPGGERPPLPFEYENALRQHLQKIRLMTRAKELACIEMDRVRRAEAATPAEPVDILRVLAKSEPQRRRKLGCTIAIEAHVKSKPDQVTGVEGAADVDVVSDRPKP